MSQPERDPDYDPDYPPEENIPTLREAERTLLLVREMPDQLSHEQYVSLLAIAFRYGVLNDRDYQNFLDVRDPIKFMPTAIALRQLMMERLTEIVEKGTMAKCLGVPAVNDAARTGVKSVIEKTE